MTTQGFRSPPRASCIPPVDYCSYYTRSVISFWSSACVTRGTPVLWGNTVFWSHMQQRYTDKHSVSLPRWQGDLVSLAIGIRSNFAVPKATLVCTQRPVAWLVSHEMDRLYVCAWVCVPKQVTFVCGTHRHTHRRRYWKTFTCKHCSCPTAWGWLTCGPNSFQDVNCWD